MLVMYCLGWWYGRGWKWRLDKSLQAMRRWADFFSIGKLLATLFAPYRQTFAANGRGPAGSMVQAVMDNLVSRFVGFFVRFFYLVAAGLVLLFYMLLTLVALIVWPVIPFLPAVGVVLAILGGKL